MSWLALLLACGEGPGQVEVWLTCERPIHLSIEAVTLRAEEAPWEAPWEALAAASGQLEVHTGGTLVAEGSVPAGTWVHVFPDILDPSTAGEPLADVVEPIAARFWLPPGAARSITVALLVLDDTPEGPALFAVDTTVSPR